MAINSRLFMEVGFVNSTFEAIDKTPYERWINDSIFDSGKEHMVIQRLVQIADDEYNKLISIQVITTNDLEEIRNPYEKEKLTNGLYYYQKVIIPAEDHGTNANEQLYYDESGKIYFLDRDAEEIEQYDAENDFDEIYEIIRKYYPDNCFYFDDYSFTIYDLIECFVLTERDRINNYLKNNCNKACDKNTTDLDTNADILLAAIMVIRDLMEKGDYFEAQRILNGLNTCGSLCKKFQQKLNTCNCGRA